MSRESFEQFRLFVLRNAPLQERLRDAPDTRTFVNLVVRAGEEHGFRFTPEEVEEALREARRAWLERWI